MDLQIQFHCSEGLRNRKKVMQISLLRDFSKQRYKDIERSDIKFPLHPSLQIDNKNYTTATHYIMKNENML